MRHLALFTPIVGLVLVAACDGDDAAPPSTAPDSGTSTPADGGSSGNPDGGSDSSTETGDAAADVDAGPPYVEPSCLLLNDSGGPGQYSSSCVQRSWIQAYAGKYTSATCELTIDITGPVAATFKMKVLSGPLAGDYTTDWDGAPSPGNDSYYRFTTDATYTTTKALNFTSGQKVGTSDERALLLRVDGLDTGTVVFKGRYIQVVSAANQEHDCDVMTRQ